MPLMDMQTGFYKLSLNFVMVGNPGVWGGRGMWWAGGFGGAAKLVPVNRCGFYTCTASLLICPGCMMNSSGPWVGHLCL